MIVPCPFLPVSPEPVRAGPPALIHLPALRRGRTGQRTGGGSRAGLAVMILSCLSAFPTHAEDDEAPLELDPVVVVASKRPVNLSEVAGQISILSGPQLADQLTENLDQALRYEPGVYVETGSTRFGGDVFVLRGVGGNRVSVEVDGVPLRDGFAIGSYSNAGRALVETDRIARLEILYGPASVYYGSDALGGVLAITTLDPDDLVARSRGDRYFGLRTGWQSANEAWVASGQAAWANGAHGFSISATAREGRERDSGAVDSGGLDPQDWQTRDYAARYTFDTAGGHRLRVGLERFERDVVTEVRSLLGFRRFARTTRLDGDDEDERTRMLVDYEFSAEWLHQGQLRAFLDDSTTRQATEEERAPPPAPRRLHRDFRLDTKLQGLEFVGAHEIALGNTDHQLGFGMEWLSTDLEELRDGFEENLDTGEISQVLLGETLPTRDFPNTTTRELGVFIEDAIRFSDGRWELTPALRLERYEVEPRPDPVYENAFPDLPVVHLDESAITPRLSARYTVNDRWSVYGLYTEGFRAPPVEDVNIGFELPRFRYRAIPNPDLESETSRGYELGLRRFSDHGRLALTWFDTRYDDLIESRARIGVDPDSGFLEFQSRNIGRARIYGADLRLDQGLGALNESLTAWTIRTALLWTRGDNETRDEPLNTVSPPQAILGVGWRPGDGRLDLALTATFTAEQDRIDTTDGALFAPPSWNVLDLSLAWRPDTGAGLDATLRAGVFNVLDETYWRWEDVRNLAPDDPMIPLLAQPGRNLQASLQLGF